MNRCLWFYWLIIGGLTIVPFVMLYLDYRVHRNSISYALRCPVFWAISGASVIALVTAVALYPSSYGMISVFFFAMGLPLALAAQDLPAANRAPNHTP